MRILSILLILFALAEVAAAQTLADLFSFDKKNMSEESWQQFVEDSQRSVDEGIPLPDGLEPFVEHWNKARKMAEADLAWSRAFFPESLWNERGMMETYFELADCMPQAAIPKLMAACGVSCGLSYDSPVVGHYISSLQQLLDAEEVDVNSPLARLAPSLKRRLAG